MHYLKIFQEPNSRQDNISVYNTNFCYPSIEKKTIGNKQNIDLAITN